jgi:hypothetical protein
MKKMCVRCGRRPRSGEMFVCEDCLHDRAFFKEMGNLRRIPFEEARRKAIAEYHWAGGWGRV